MSTAKGRGLAGLRQKLRCHGAALESSSLAGVGEGKTCGWLAGVEWVIDSGLFKTGDLDWAHTKPGAVPSLGQVTSCYCSYLGAADQGCWPPPLS